MIYWDCSWGGSGWWWKEEDGGALVGLKQGDPIICQSYFIRVTSLVLNRLSVHGLRVSNLYTE